MSPPLLSQRDAAAVCGVSRTTIRRRREAGSFPNAVRDGVLGWLIPEDDLRAAGLQLSRSAGLAGRNEADPAMGSDRRDSPVLDRQLVEECPPCELAEAEVGRLRHLLGLQEQQLTVLRRALHVLTADPPSGSDQRGAGQGRGAGDVVRPRGEAGADETHR
ncbi:helix-turn-helix transcriptional regulator [Streptomyces sp. MCA2]|uniref:helix-turn-helix transcriptional regulator n=1 Tax=Streptomyces sp. MCA2 TaxID=2944805 RepID=UPI0035AC051B